MVFCSGLRKYDHCFIHVEQGRNGCISVLLNNFLIIQKTENEKTEKRMRLTISDFFVSKPFTGINCAQKFVIKGEI